MDIEFDPEKNRKNIAWRGLSFDDVPLLDWDNALLWKDTRKEYGELRYCALALMADEDKLYAVTFTLRGNIIRVISFRRANERERRSYDDKTSRNTG